MKFLPLLVAVAAFLVACSTPPQSLDESLGMAEAQISGFEQSASQALARGVITVDEAQKILSLSDMAVDAIRAARDSERKGDMAGANANLSFAISFLNELTNYLTAHGVK